MKRALFPFAVGCIFAANANAQSVAPVAGVEVGRVNVVSMGALTPEVRKIVGEDLKRSAVGAATSYESIPDEAVNYMKDFHSHLIHPREITRNTTFKTSDVAATDLARFTFEGAYPQGPTQAGPWTSLARVFKRDDNVLVILHEWDYIKDGGRVMMVKELMNEQVGRSPARFAVKRSPSGAFVSELTWATQNRFYTLTVLDKASTDQRQRYNRKWMTNLASSIR